MYRYYLTKSTDEEGQNVVHILYCTHGVEETDRENLGFHLHGKPAIEAAKRIQPNLNIKGCPYCCPET